MPFFSIIIPLYNKGNHITETITSALNQTFLDFEIIIINDGSTDDSELKVKLFNDSRIILYNQSNHGVSAARNKGIKKAKAPYICFLDADDIWKPNHLDSFYSSISKYPDECFFGNGYYFDFGNGKHKMLSNKIFEENTARIVLIKDFFDYALPDVLAWTSAICIKKEVLVAIDSFDEKITYGAGEDIDLWIRLGLLHSFVFNKNITAVYKQYTENKLTKINPNKRNFLDPNKYKTNGYHTLNRYLDQNIFYIYMDYKLAKAEKKMLKKNIDLKNLSLIQKILLYMPSNILRFLYNSKYYLFSCLKIDFKLNN